MSPPGCRPRRTVRPRGTSIITLDSAVAVYWLTDEIALSVERIKDHLTLASLVVPGLAIVLDEKPIPAE